MASDKDPELATVVHQWEKLGLGEVDHRARRALENRRSEGATLEQLEAATAGAAADEWIRRRAKVPFAVVFASIASVERFAHEGRKILSSREQRAKREADERRRDEEWRVQARDVLRAEKPPEADALLRLLPPPVARKSASQPTEPLTPEELVRRKADQLAALQALMLATESK